MATFTHASRQRWRTETRRTQAELCFVSVVPATHAATSVQYVGSTAHQMLTSFLVSSSSTRPSTTALFTPLVNRSRMPAPHVQVNQ